MRDGIHQAFRVRLGHTSESHEDPLFLAKVYTGLASSVPRTWVCCIYLVLKDEILAGFCAVLFRIADRSRAAR